MMSSDLRFVERSRGPVVFVDHAADQHPVCALGAYGAYPAFGMTMPGQQGSWRDQPAAPQGGGQHLGQAPPGQPSLAWDGADRAAGHDHLVTQHHDLRLLGRLATAQQDRPVEAAPRPRGRPDPQPPGTPHQAMDYNRPGMSDPNVKMIPTET